MLEVQKYLRSGHTFADLNSEYDIGATLHPTLPLAILNYGIHSTKTEPICRECRGLVLNSNDYGLVARSFYRFFNYGEVIDEWKNFVFDNCTIQEKVDGSLINLFYFDGAWRVTTRSSFANQVMCKFSPLTWEQGICEALGVTDLQKLNIDKSLSYILEYVGPFNKVVRQYNKQEVYLLTTFFGEQEQSPGTNYMIWDCYKQYFKTPQTYQFHSVEQVQAYITEVSPSDPTWEGVVLRDCNNLRFKVKNPRYLELHRLKGANNCFNPKVLLPFVLNRECEEIILYYPEAIPIINDLQLKVEEIYLELIELWRETHHIPNQKEFALAIVGKTHFASTLFNLRKKRGLNQTVSDLRAEWLSKPELIEKVLLK